MAKSSKGFVYKPRSEASMRERVNRPSNKFDSMYKQGFEELKPRGGDNCYRILPPTWDDPDHYAYKVFVHFNVGKGRYLCLSKMLGKKCPACEAEKEMRSAGEKKEADQIATRERYIAWVLDRDGDDPEKPQLWAFSWTADQEIAAHAVHPRTGAIITVDHPSNGYDLMFKRKGIGLDTEYYGYQFDRSSSPIHESDAVQDKILEFVMENPIPDVLKYYDYDHISAALNGTTPEKDDEVDEAGDAPFDGGRRHAEPELRQETTTRSARRTVVEEDEDQEVQPARRTSTRQQVDEPVNEEEENSPPRRSSARRTIVEEDEETAPRRRVSR